MDKTLHQLCSRLFKSIKKLKNQEEIREDSRVAYDHYRNKLTKLEKTHANSKETKKVETYNRNVEKFNKAKAEFDIHNNKLDKMLENIQAGGEYIIDQICIRFTMEVESKFFTQMRDIY